MIVDKLLVDDDESEMFDDIQFYGDRWIQMLSEIQRLLQFGCTCKNVVKIFDGFTEISNYKLRSRNGQHQRIKNNCYTKHPLIRFVGYKSQLMILNS